MHAYMTHTRTLTDGTLAGSHERASSTNRVLQKTKYNWVKGKKKIIINPKRKIKTNTKQNNYARMYTYMTHALTDGANNNKTTAKKKKQKGQ